MNRFVKKNIVLIGILAASALFAVGLLIYAIILVVDVHGYLGRTEKARDTIKKLVRQNPAPGRENEERLQHDIELYKKAAKGLQDRFKSPMQPAVDAFIAALPIPRLEKEEAEAYKVPGTGEADDEGKVAKPLEIRKLSEADFKSLLKNHYEQYTADMVEETKLRIDTQTSFIEEFRRLFSSKSNQNSAWDQAVHAFVSKAQNLTLEPIDSSNQEALLISALGFSRRVDADTAKFTDHMLEYAKRLTAAAGEMELSQQATDFLVNTSGTPIQLSPAEYPKVLYHWDVFGDIVKRLSAAKIKQIRKIDIRQYGTEENQENKERTLGTLHEQIGNYKIYHYTVEVMGSMESFRAAVKNFDEAFKENRTYIVRAVYLYSEVDAAGMLMKRSQATQLRQDANNPVDDLEEPQMMRRRRRPRRVEPQMRVEENSEEKRKLEEQERIRAAEAKLPVNERSGYGTILIGGKEDFRAFLDIDYVVLEQEQ